MTITVVGPRFEDVQWLADHHRSDGLVVSCYADVSVSSGVRSMWREHLNNEIRSVGQSLSSNRETRVIFERNIAAIEATLGAHTPSVQGMAVFSAVQRDFLRIYAVAVPLPNRLVVDQEPYLVPLLELLNRQRRYLVVHTNNHRGRLYTAIPGSTDLLREVDEDVPKRQRGIGERRGKQKGTIASHLEDRALRYAQKLAREIERVWPGERYDGIVLFGEHEVLSDVRSHLPQRLAHRLIQQGPRAPAGMQVHLEERIAAIHASELREHDRQVLEDVNHRLAERHQIVAGPQEVIDALRNGLIGFPGSVVMEPDRGKAAWRCRNCRSLFAHTVDACAYCGARCEKTNLWQSVALLAARHDIPVHVVAAGSCLEDHGGIVALVTRTEP